MVINHILSTTMYIYICITFYQLTDKIAPTGWVWWCGSKVTFTGATGGRFCGTMVAKNWL